MGKLAAGFTLGAVLTGLGFFAFLAHQDGNFPHATSPAETPASDSGASEADGVNPGLERSRSAIDPPTNNGDARPGIGEPREVQLRRLIEESRAETDALRSELQALEAARFREEQPIVLPLALPPEFAWLADTDYVNPHDQIQREHRDGAWAAAAEAELQQYLSDRPEIFRAFGYPTIECRTSRCAVAFALHGVNEDSAAINRRFDAMVADFSEQEWSESFPDTQALYSNQHGGVHTIYWSLSDIGRAIAVRRSQDRN